MKGFGNMLQEFYDRINLKSDLSLLSKMICQKYNLGKYLSDEIILVGYEDFNFILTWKVLCKNI